eukprot:COSAG01_NODE_1651_length_9623_cov_6.232045_3_plen_87_part_00
MWVALEAASGIISEHDYDPSSSCRGFSGCGGGTGAWWNVTNDPYDSAPSPLWAFTRCHLRHIGIRAGLPLSWLRFPYDFWRAAPLN